MACTGIALSQVPLSLFLRQETRHLHQQLEASSCLPESLTSTGRLLHVLEVFQSFYVDVDQWLSDECNKPALVPRYIARIPLIEADMVEWGFVIKHTSQCHDDVVSTVNEPTQLQRIGMRYVVEGSVLGGKVMSRHVNKASWRPAQPRTLHFFSLDASLTGISWGQYTTHLDSLQLSKQQQMEVLSGAKSLFTVMIDCFKRMKSHDVASSAT